MMEDEHEVYGGDIFPEEGDLDEKPINESIQVDGDAVPDDAVSKVSERVALLGRVVLLWLKTEVGVSETLMAACLQPLTRIFPFSLFLSYRRS